MERRNAWKTYTQEQLKELDQINDRYKVCLDATFLLALRV